VDVVRRWTIDGDEVDVASRKWRRRFNHFVRKPGIIAEVKRRMRRRERREGRHAVRKGVE
jgi:hypothetical protein